MLPIAKGFTTDRLAATSAATTLARLEASDLLDRRCAVVISAEAVRERSGIRWKRQRDQVWAQIEARLDEYLSPQDIRERLNETDVVVAMPREDSAGVQAVCLRILEEVLLHFLGVAEPADLRLGAVEHIDGTLVTTSVIDPGRIATAWRRGPGRAELATARRHGDYAEERRRNPVVLSARGSDALRAHFALEPVFSLRTGRVAALRVQPTVSYIVSGELVDRDRYGAVSDTEAEIIDRAALAFAALFLPQAEASGAPLIVPASFGTLGGRRGRRELVTLPGVTQEQTRRGLFIELIDIDRGTPPGRLSEVTALVGAVCRGVFVRLRAVKNADEPVRETRVQGLTVDVAHLAASDSDLTHALLAAAADLKGVAPVMIAQGLPSADFHPIAQVAGFSHAAQRAVGAIDQKDAVAA